MSMWTTAVFVSVLMLLSSAAQSQMCEEPFQATLTLITNVTYPASSNFLDPELVYYREILRFTEQEIDRERAYQGQFADGKHQGVVPTGNDASGRFAAGYLPLHTGLRSPEWLGNRCAKRRCARTQAYGTAAEAKRIPAVTVWAKASLHLVGWPWVCTVRQAIKLATGVDEANPPCILVVLALPAGTRQV